MTACPKCGGKEVEEFMSPGAIVRPISQASGEYPVSVRMIRCLNPDCGEVSKAPEPLG